MGFWGKLGKFALKAAPIAAMFIPGVGPLASMGIRAAIGAASGAAGGGGWKGALLGGGMGAIPTGGGIGGSVGSLAGAGLKEGAKQVGKQVGMQAGMDLGGKFGGKYLGGAAGGAAAGAIGALGSGGWQGLATGAAKGATGGGTKSGIAQTGADIGLNVFNNRGGGQSQGGNVYNSYLPQQVGNSFAPRGSQATGGLPKGAKSAAPTGGDWWPTHPQGGGQQPGAPWPQQPGSPGQAGGGSWQQTWGGPISQVGGIVAGGIAARAAEKGALKRSPEEAAAIAGARGSADAQSQQAGNLFNAASGLTSQGRQWLEQPASYYKTLLSGNRAAQANALAAPTAGITETYRGAERNLERSGVRGAAKDVAAGELGRQRASQIAGLHTGVQNTAADSLAKLGEAGLNQAGALYGPAANMMGNAGQIHGNLLNNAYLNRSRAMDEGADVGKEIGGFVRDTLPVVLGSGKPSPGQIPTAGSKPAPQPTTVPGGNVPRPPVAQLPKPQQLPWVPPTTQSRPIGTGMGSSPSWWRS